MTPSDLKKEKQKMKKEKKFGNEPLAASDCAPTLRVRRDPVKNLMTPSDLKKEKKHGNEPSAASGCVPTLRLKRVKNLMTPSDWKKEKTRKWIRSGFGIQSRPAKTHSKKK
jgi:hypothetical protein